LVFLYPLLVLIIDHGGSTIYSVLALLGLFFATFQHREDPLRRDEKLLFFSVIFFVLAAILVILCGDNIVQGVGKLGKFAKLLLLIPAYFLLRKITLPQSVFWYGLACGAILSGIIAVYEITSGPLYGGYHGRARGATHPILFGNLSLVMGVMALAGFGYFRGQSKWLVLVPIVAAICGLLASLLSSSRGGWVAMPALVVIVFWYLRSYLSRWQIVFSAAFVLLLPLMAYLAPGSGVAYRVGVTLNNFKLYAESPIDHAVRGTSVGTRLEMWQASWTIFKNNPILGIGWGNYQEHAKALVAEGVRHRSAAYWGHPHNEYFSVLVSGGLLGFVALLLLFFIPAKLFFAATKNQNAEMQRLGLSGLLLVVGYMHFALSEAIFERSLPVNFYAFYLLVIMVLISQQRKQVDEGRCPKYLSEAPK